MPGWLSIVIMLFRLAWDIWQIIKSKQNPAERRMLQNSFKVVAQQAVEQDDASLLDAFVDAHGLRKDLADRRRLRRARRKKKRGAEDLA